MSMDDKNVAISLLGQQMGDVTIETHEGSVYAFPNMNVSEMERVLPEPGRQPENMPCLVLVNVSFAVLSMPLRIIKSVRIGDKELWHD